MSVSISLPEILGGISEAQLVRWLVDVGDQVSVDQAVCEILTDKAVVELPSPQAGKVTEIYVQKGDTIHTGDTLLRLDKLKLISEKAKMLASPSVRRLIREHKIDPERLQGSGERGRVLLSDVHEYLKRQQSRDSESNTLPRKAGIEDLTPIRRTITKRLSDSVHQKPHVTHFEECDVSGLVQWYREIKKGNLTYTSLLMKILSHTVQNHPRFNAHYDEKNQQIRSFPNVDIGVAMQTEKGLLVPVVRNVEQKCVRNIADELQELIQKAKKGVLHPEEMRGSTITLSNAGPLGGIGATPIIQTPEVAILATHRIEQRAIVVDDSIKSGWRMNFSLSFDHRVLDGSDAMLFSQTFQKFTKQPLSMI